MTTSPAHASGGIGRRCGSCTPPGPASWPPAPTPAASPEALIVTAPEPLRDRLRGRPWRQQLGACAGLVAVATDPVEYRATMRALHLTAQRALAARADAKQLEAELPQLVMAMAPALLAQPGIGPISAAQLLLGWSHPGRFRSEAAFAMLAGAAPVPASSGRSSVIAATGVGIGS